MKRTILLLTLLVLTMSVHAQSRYCMSFGDYLADKWYTLDHLQLEYRSDRKAYWNGGANYKPVTGDKKTDKLLKKEARLIQHHDTLYINCHQLSCDGVAFGNWYARTIIFENDYFLFVAPNVKTKQKVSNVTFMFGAIGGTIAATASRKDYLCYVFNPATEMVEALDKDVMVRLLESQPDLQAEYEKADPKHKCRADVVIPFLQRLGLIERGE